MAHRGSIFPLVVHFGSYLGTFIVGILTGLFGHVGKHSIDRADDLAKLIDEIRGKISDFEKPLPPITLALEGFHGNTVRIHHDFSNYAFELKSKLKRIQFYRLIRHVVRLPPKKNVCDAIKLLPQLLVQEFGDPQVRQDALSIAKKIQALLA